MSTQRMRVGLSGRLMSADATHTVAVLYSLDGYGSRGRLRPQDPTALFPSWIEQESRLKLYAHDSVPLDIVITLIKVPRPGWQDDDHFAEFVVRQVTH